MPLQFSKYQDGKVDCKFPVRMDTEHCINSEKQLMEAIKESKSIVFDLEGVEYIASSFFRLCSKASNMVGQKKFSTINATPSVKKVFKIAGLAEVLNLS